ncbi:Hsp70 family protein [Nonomuraea zeae]|uniref:Hsp70 family protein n=1 Tax=Nonomuraea zeae TaxID=1642303 RepID=A0A5S4G932_9ACTN|nr:hypothetical protein [Nonomuraea zeae]TMR29516.1 hypothetical protein ETD85_32210 [Nonomuraea zeae]
MPDATPELVIGFDLGHGESALAQAEPVADTQVKNLDMPYSDTGRQVTAVGLREGEVLIGTHALFSATADLTLGFKSPRLDRDDVRIPTARFVRRTVEELVDGAKIRRDQRIRWVFGHPSGWSPEVRETYAAVLREACGDDLEVVPESRAAFLYTRYNLRRERADTGRISRTTSALCIDCGSSTCDYTWVRQGRSSPVDLGHNSLGASLIDKMIMDVVLARHPGRERLTALLDRYPIRRPLVEYTCRRAKEMYFLTPAERLTDRTRQRHLRAEELEFPNGETFDLDIRLSADDMDAVLDTPHPSLEGLTWREAYKRNLSEVLREIGATPDLVIVTGGPSRMRFILDITRELVGTDRVILGSEPETAIARGLAIAGQIGVTTQSFRAEVDALIASGKIDRIVEARLPELAEGMGLAVASGLTERHVIPAFVEWRNGGISTLDDMARKIADAVQAEITDPRNDALKQTMVDWQNGIVPDIERLTEPICERAGLPSAALNLPVISLDHGQVRFSVPLSAATDVLNTLGNVVNVILAGVISTTLFGAGVSLIAATGPLAVVIAFVAAFVAMKYGQERAMERARAMNLPKLARQVTSEQRLLRKLRAEAQVNESALATELAQEFLTGQGTQMAASISGSLRGQLDAVAKDAALLIE